MQKSPAPKKAKSNRPLLLVLALAVLVAAGVSGFLLLARPGNPTATVEPTKATGYRPDPATPSATASQTVAAAKAAVTPTLNPGLTTVAATTATVGQTPTPTGSVDDRFGLIVTGLEKEPSKTASLNHALDLSQARWWYQYTTDRPSGVNPQARQIYMIRTWFGAANGDNFKVWMDFIKQTGHFNRPTYWLIGNEPNTPGQDDTTPEAYAEAVYEANRAIRAADPQATVLGPNILNFDVTCQGCPGFTPGRTWLDQTRKVYQSRYGGELPFDGWTIHTYSLDWDHLPLINQAQDSRQLEAFRSYLDATPATKGKPIWLTEFGVVWGYDSLDFEKDASGTFLAMPKGPLRQDLMEKYLSDTLDWLQSNADRLKIERWFVFSSYGETETFSNVYGGISLFDGSSPTANLTAFGRIYTDRLKRVATKP